MVCHAQVGGCVLDCPASTRLPAHRCARSSNGRRDLDFSNPDTNLCSALGTDPPNSCSMDSYFDEILKDTEHHACTHTHTCNPPVHDLSHTHTCVHVHTKIVAASPGDGVETAESPSENNNTTGNSNAASKKRPSGNRATVRKYREKKKAHTASLEEEVVHLWALNQQLMKKLQSHAALEAEVAKLRCLLVDIRGRIEGEIGAFPYQRPAGGRTPRERRLHAWLRPRKVTQKGRKFSNPKRL
ncbi:basic leucine zipper 23-like [Miscanthus floridulus]|uniref:basic leucine zipper 23-like n=1 Tax=Miscanthus floridulus TaxID=154761 RepID=UPI003458B5D6